MTVLRDVYCVLQGPDRRAVQLMLCIAIINQGMASNSIINYAPQLLQSTHTANSHAVLWTSFITIAKVQTLPVLSKFFGSRHQHLQQVCTIMAACHPRIQVLRVQTMQAVQTPRLQRQQAPAGRAAEP